MPVYYQFTTCNYLIAQRDLNQINQTQLLILVLLETGRPRASQHFQYLTQDQLTARDLSPVFFCQFQLSPWFHIQNLLFHNFYFRRSMLLITSNYTVKAPYSANIFIKKRWCEVNISYYHSESRNSAIVSTQTPNYLSKDQHLNHL